MTPAIHQTSWAAALAAICVLCSCGDSATAPASTATGGVPTASPAPSPSPSPNVVYPSAPPGTQVARQALPPATDLPVASLCSAQLEHLADGNAAPLFCRGGEVNVLAWKYLSDVSSSILGLGLNPMLGQVQSAICDDIKHTHATGPQETSAYQLATAYYGWSFNIDPSHVSCQ